MENEKDLRNYWLHLRLSGEELRIITNFQLQTTCHSRSAYARTVLLQQPVTVKYRNSSLDAILGEMIRLKNELHAIGVNFNQAVHHLHTLDRYPDLRAWVVLEEAALLQFKNKEEEIRTYLVQLYSLWSSK